jgi:hypothetical protein
MRKFANYFRLATPRNKEQDLVPYGLYLLVVEWGACYCHHSAPKVPGTARRSRFKFVAEVETVPGPGWQGRQSEDACLARRIGQTERVTNR